MSKNKEAREELQRLFGAQCFIEKLGLRKDKKNYKGKNQKEKMNSKAKRLTYHHIIEKHLGGPATVENGALLSEKNHHWFHKQPIEEQIEMDRKMQEYKIRKLTEMGIIDQYGEFRIPNEGDFFTGKNQKNKKNGNSFKSYFQTDNYQPQTILEKENDNSKVKYELRKIYELDER